MYTCPQTYHIVHIFAAYHTSHRLNVSANGVRKWASLSVREGGVRGGSADGDQLFRCCEGRCRRSHTANCHPECPQNTSKHGIPFFPSFFPLFQWAQPRISVSRWEISKNQKCGFTRINIGQSVDLEVVGRTRFELVTFCTPSKRATRLRYRPTWA